MGAALELPEDLVVQHPGLMRLVLTLPSRLGPPIYWRQNQCSSESILRRAAHESDPALHYWLKILANSGSYGLFVELNPNDANDASLITAGGRLLLAMLEKCITDSGGTYLFCDTDSAAIVATKTRRNIAMPDGAKPITALSWDEVDEIVQRFKKLNPYNLKGSILKIH